MIAGEIGIDRFGYGFLDATIQGAGDAGPVKAKILRIDSGDGVIIQFPFRAEHWAEFQRLVAEQGPVSSIIAVGENALRNAPSIEEILGNGKG